MNKDQTQTWMHEFETCLVTSLLPPPSITHKPSNAFFVRLAVNSGQLKTDRKAVGERGSDTLQAGLTAGRTQP